MTCDSPGERSWARRVLVFVCLVAIGLVPAGPFLTRRAVGTSEAYNYNLSLADAVTQLCAGVLPPLVGQTPFAFNGRIHPLRNAPYLVYLAGLLDLGSGHRLSFWELQNLSLALSLFAAGFGCYLGLRWATGCGRAWALALSAAYAWCPALLAAADVHDLLMTVYAAPYLPLALAGCLRQGRVPAVRNDLIMAGALAAAWLAHPPVALWMTAVVGLVRLAIFFRRPSVRSLAGLAAAGAFFLGLAGFGFISAGTVTPGRMLLGAVGAFRQDYAREVLENLRAAFPAVLLPVSRQIRDLGNMQLGYAHWLLLAFALAGVVRTRDRWNLRWVSALALVGGALLLLAFCLPIPGLTHALWLHLPPMVHLLTNIWPMQRLYLVATVVIVFAAALTPPEVIPRWPARILIVAGLAWTLGQAGPFRANEYSLRWSPAATAASQLESNIDLSATSYAFFGLPDDYTSGVIDPLLHLRLLAVQNGAVTADLALPSLAHAPVVQQGLFRRMAPGSDRLTPGLTLQPGKRYLLQLDFLTGPVRVYLNFSGEGMRRSYRLPDAGGEAGFGMAPQNSHRLSLWTALDHPEQISLEIPAWGDAAAPREPPVDFARFTLRELDPADLPVRLESFLPLRCTVDAPRDGLYLETFRQFLSGYTAKVGDRAVPVLRSPAGNVMIPVPEGRSEVEVSYAGSPLLLVSFRLSAACWLGWVLWLVAGVGPGAAHRGGIWLLRRGRPILVSAGALLAAAAAWHYASPEHAVVGPIRVRYLLPLDRTGTNQPLVVLGHDGTGAIIFLNLTDPHHVRVGADAWGTLTETEPIAVDYNRIQELVVSGSALYPPDDPRTRAIDPGTLRELRDELRVDLNGRVALTASHPPNTGETEEVRLGENVIGGSFAGPRFSGEILSRERLPVPDFLGLAPGRALRVQAQLPVGRGRGREPLLTVAGADQTTTVYAVRVSPESLRVGIFSSAGKWLESRDLPAGAGGSLDLVVRPGRTAGERLIPAIAIDRDGAQVLGPADLHPWPDSLQVTVGRNLTASAPVSADYAGAALYAEVLPGPAGIAGYGPYDLVLSFPKNRTGRSEPLLVSGTAGAADLVYVTYADARHLRVGLDHWSRGGATSGLVPIDYDANHEVEISLGSLYPPENDARWGGIPPAGQQARRDRISVRVDGRVVMDAPVAAYPAAPAEITVGGNRIGGSTCDPQFTGRILLAGRRPIAAP
jgi:hypothetical protein